MQAAIKLDHQLLAVQDEHTVHAMLELTAPPPPEGSERPPLNLAAGHRPFRGHGRAQARRGQGQRRLLGPPLNAVDVGRRRCGIEVLASKEEWEVATGLLRLWGRLGVPRVAQFDNGQTIAGHHRHLALAARLCLHLGIRVRFIPFAEPWRNGVVEHFNEVFDKRFFRTERFRDLAHLVERAAGFETFHNTHHRYSALRGATPEEWERRLGFVPTHPLPGPRSPPSCPAGDWSSSCDWSARTAW